MKFIVMQCWIDAEGNIGTPVQNFDNEADAWSRYHGILSQAAKSNYIQHGAIIMNPNRIQCSFRTCRQSSLRQRKVTPSMIMIRYGTIPEAFAAPGSAIPARNAPPSKPVLQ